MREMSAFAREIMEQRYSWGKDGRKETWEEIAHRVATNVMAAVNAPEELVKEIEALIVARKFIPGGRYLAMAGREYHQVNNCLLLRAEDKREGWADLLYKATLSLMSGAGIGVEYSALREKGAPLKRTGGVSSGPVELMKMVNECARGAMQGGSRRAALWAGLKWSHPDVFEFINLKNWSEDIRTLKAKDFNFPAPMDFTNISVLLDDEFFEAYENAKNPAHKAAKEIYWCVVNNMLRTGEPGFSVNLSLDAKETLKNACTEITSGDDSDICNIGSLNLENFSSREEFSKAVRLATVFLLAGTVYSDVPYDKVKDVRVKNRRLGLGLMGVHAWLIKRDYSYAPSTELSMWLEEYKKSDVYAKEFASKWGLTVPVKTRAIAPNGTISIVAETTSGIEPIFCVAYKRRYFNRGEWRFQYVVDPTAQRLIEEGADPSKIEDAYKLSNDVERRIRMQAWLQSFVDHGISSTINLPQWGSENNNENTVEKFGKTLYKLLPLLRGITCYPDGARSGQPLTAVSYEETIRNKDQIFIESSDVCDLRGGSCGS